MGTRADEIGQLDRRHEYATPEYASAGAGTRDVTEAGTEEAQIRADIERTRAGMSETIDALQEKLSPERIMEQVKEKVQEQAADALDSAKQAVKDATIGKAGKLMDNVSESVGYATRKLGTAMDESTMLSTIKENPLPFMLIGAGLGWLAFNKRSSSRSDRYYKDRLRGDYRSIPGGSDRWERERRGFSGQYGQSEQYGQSQQYGQSEQRGYVESAKETVSQVADRTQEAVSSAASNVRNAASTVADKTREQVNYLSEQAGEQARRAGDTFETVLRDYPLAVGVAALAAGAAAGLMMPSTRVEREYMGEAREQFVEKAQTLAKDTVHKVQRVAEEAGRTVQEEAQHQGLTNAS